MNETFGEYETPVYPLGTVMVHMESGFVVEVIGFAAIKKPHIMYLIQCVDDTKVRDWAEEEDLTFLDKSKMN